MFLQLLAVPVCALTLYFPGLLLGIVAKDNGVGASLNDARCEQAFASVCERVHIPNPLLADGFHKRDGTNCWYKYYVSPWVPPHCTRFQSLGGAHRVPSPC